MDCDGTGRKATPSERDRLALVDRALRRMAQSLRRNVGGPSGYPTAAHIVPIPKKTDYPTESAKLRADASATQHEAVWECVNALPPDEAHCVLVRHRLRRVTHINRALFEGLKQPSQRLYDEALRLLLGMFNRRHVVLLE
jgi:hypothetical protein